jgi:hypothetical protein
MMSRAAAREEVLSDDTVEAAAQLILAVVALLPNGVNLTHDDEAIARLLEKYRWVIEEDLWPEATAVSTTLLWELYTHDGGPVSACVYEEAVELSKYDSKELTTSLKAAAQHSYLLAQLVEMQQEPGSMRVWTLGRVARAGKLLTALMLRDPYLELTGPGIAMYHDQLLEGKNPDFSEVETGLLGTLDRLELP